MDGFQNINFCEVLELWKYSFFFHMIFPKGDAKFESRKKKKKAK